MVGQPKVSVIIPIHNMEEYLGQSIKSWADQTLKDIEIICIDDASTDSSLEILMQYAQKDSRIKAYSFTENKSAWSARKYGIENATGQYIMFADADDTILPNACEELYHEAQEAQVDILHFDAEIINVNGLPESRIQSMERFLKPYDGSFEGKDVFTACFREQKYKFTLWNKVFRSEICKQAITELEYAVLPKAQDKLLYFALAYSANSYKGIVDKKYYQYYFGRGATGFNRLTNKQFERYCTMAWVADKIEEFLKAKGVCEEYQDIVEKNRNELLNDCVARWQNEVPVQNKATCFDLMVRYWKPYEVIGKLAQKHFYNRCETAKWLKGTESLIYNKREVKTIATYYHSCSNGGAQRVVCQLATLWIEMGYNVVIMTDEEPTADDYYVPETVRRVVIPHYRNTNPTNYRERAKAIGKIIAENNVDLVVYHAWVLNLMLWDELVCKLSGAAFIAHCHSIFSVGMLNAWENYRNTIMPYTLADGVVCLSGPDRRFWQNINNNVFETINPFTDKIDEWNVTSGENHHILWLGRLSDEKRPYDALHILKRVLNRVPDAKLHIVGDGKTPEYMSRIKEKITELELQGDVLLHGFHKDVKQFYQNASVFLLTSAYEGYSLSLQESKMAGMPCVMYEMPYLMLCREERGMIAVGQQKIDEAADAIVMLFEDKEAWKKHAKEAREHVEELYGYDFTKKWKMIIESVTQTHEQAVSEDERIMIETLLYHRDMGYKKQDAKYRSVKEEYKKKKDEYERKNRHGKLVRYAILIEKGIMSLRKNGIRITMKKTLKKLIHHFTKRK